MQPLKPVSGSKGAGFTAPRWLGPGQVVRLTLVERGIGGGIVSLAGKLMRAQGHLPSQPGTSFWALIEDVSHGEIRVRRAGDAPGRDGMTARDIVKLLGLPPGRDSAFIVQQLLLRQQPVDAEWVRRMLREGAALPPDEREAFWQAQVWLRSLNVTSEAGALQKVLRFVLGDERAEPEGQAILNGSQEAHSGTESLLALFLSGGERLQGRVFLQRYGGNGDASENTDGPLRIVLDLENRVLGGLWVVLQYENRELSGEIVPSDDRFARVLENALPELQAALAEAGFRVGDFRVGLRQVRSVFDLLKTTDEIRYVSLDVKV
ncbi:MAG: flagellar hook-length control protein FliK [Peptococcaceae bacterium]|nr:flagellar hook-length control protein FliK [Peptococcaceae bacterium]